MFWVELHSVYARRPADGEVGSSINDRILEVTATGYILHHHQRGKYRMPMLTRRECLPRLQTVTQSRGNRSVTRLEFSANHGLTVKGSVSI